MFVMQYNNMLLKRQINDNSKTKPKTVDQFMVYCFLVLFESLPVFKLSIKIIVLL